MLTLGLMAIVAVALGGCREDARPEPTPAGHVADPAASTAPPVASSGQESFGVDKESGESFGPPAPDFTLQALDGGTFRLSEHRGEVVVLNFWATWCGPCRMEMPGFVRLQKELGDRGLQFVGVSLDEEGASVVRPFAEELEINYPLLLDDYSVADLYGMTDALPTTFLINRKGQVVAHLPGMLTEDMLLPVLEELLRESAPAAKRAG